MYKIRILKQIINLQKIKSCKCYFIYKSIEPIVMDEIDATQNILLFVFYFQAIDNIQLTHHDVLHNNF